MTASTVVNTVRFDLLSRDELVERVDLLAAGRGSSVVRFLPAHPTVIARTDAAYRDILNRSRLNIPDGASVVVALRLLGHRAERLPGSTAFELVCAAGLAADRRHFLYGGTSEVIERLESVLEERHPGLRIVGSEAPPFRAMTPAELDAAAARIRASGADLLWVGLGTPKQDVVAEHLRLQGAAPVILCVGAAFDFISGAKRRAPRWMQRAGLEWLHRLGSEPRRLWRRYLIGNVSFIVGVARDLVRR